jgi:large subunit ribosomal protein L10
MPNAKVLESKKAVVDQLTDRIGKATAVVFVDYKGITVAQDTELRNKFREAGVEYNVVKNTLTRFAANKAGFTEFDEVLNGTTSMATTTDDPIAPARIVSEFAKKNKNALRIKGGIVEGKVQTVDALNAFGELPSKNALVAQVLGTFLAPISSLAFVIDQIRQQKEGPAPAEA